MNFTALWRGCSKKRKLFIHPLTGKMSARLVYWALSFNKQNFFPNVIWDTKQLHDFYKQFRWSIFPVNSTRFMYYITSYYCFCYAHCVLMIVSGWFVEIFCIENISLFIVKVSYTNAHTTVHTYIYGINFSESKS